MKRYAILNATSTHPNPKAVTASYLTVIAANYMIIQRKDPQDIISYCLKALENLESK
jgi:hypothetical protein